MTVSAFGVEDSRISKADKRHDADPAAAVGAVAGGTAGVAAARKPRREANRMQRASDTAYNSAKGKLSGNVAEASEKAGRLRESGRDLSARAVKLRRIARRRVGAGALVGATAAVGVKTAYDKRKSH